MASALRLASEDRVGMGRPIALETDQLKLVTGRRDFLLGGSYMLLLLGVLRRLKVG